MNKIIELFRKELIEISCLKDATVRLYMDMVYNYAEYAKHQLHINPLTSKTWHIHKWMYNSKIKGKGYNFIKDSKVAFICNKSRCIFQSY